MNAREPVAKPNLDPTFPERPPCAVHQRSRGPPAFSTQPCQAPAGIELVWFLPLVGQSDPTWNVVSEPRGQITIRRSPVHANLVTALLESLAELEGRPWGEWNRGRPITARQLGSLLGRFGIKPGTIRVGDTTPKGYVLGDLADTFGRYLPDGSATSATSSKLLNNQVEFEPPQAPLHEGSENGHNRLDFADVADVAARSAEREPGCDDEVPF
jgi:hypothetical protein